MIDLPGGDLASKRQAKNRFMRNYAYRVEPYAPPSTSSKAAFATCWSNGRFTRMPSTWKRSDANALKRSKESIATAGTLRSIPPIRRSGSREWSSTSNGNTTTPPTEEKIAPDPVFLLRGFTFGEVLGNDQSSITIEKTDLEIKGLAQFIFSEFCRLNWADRPLVNVGDDWGVQTLAWTKQSYRPVKLLPKFMLKQCRPVGVGAGPAGDVGSTRARRVRGAKKTTPAALLG